jgi:hypothetical protein
MKLIYHPQSLLYKFNSEQVTVIELRPFLSTVKGLSDYKVYTQILNFADHQILDFVFTRRNLERPNIFCDALKKSEE